MGIHIFKSFSWKKYESLKGAQTTFLKEKNKERLGEAKVPKPCVHASLSTESFRMQKRASRETFDVC